jgi:hypothetical protein
VSSSSDEEATRIGLILSSRCLCYCCEADQHQGQHNAPEYPAYSRNPARRPFGGKKGATGQKHAYELDHWYVSSPSSSSSSRVRPRKRSCDSMTDSWSCARSNPARPLLGLLLRSLSIRRSAAATRSRALQVGNGVLPRLRPLAFRARSLRGPPGEDGRLAWASKTRRVTTTDPILLDSQRLRTRWRHQISSGSNDGAHILEAHSWHPNNLGPSTPASQRATPISRRALSLRLINSWREWARRRHLRKWRFSWLQGDERCGRDVEILMILLLVYSC